MKKPLLGFIPALLGVAMSFLCSAPLHGSQPAGTLPSEIPETFKRRTDTFNYVRREEMIPMRDGVKLKTYILVPKGARDAPMLMNRTPYNASRVVSRADSPNLASVVGQMFDTAVAAGYIIVAQDVRGRHGSEGDYVMNRALRGPLNPTDVDHATDTWDTVDWLVKNVPESNGRVGTMGVSYDGFTAIIATVRPHPALRAAVPIGPMIDGWMGDDWFHYGAFRQATSLDFIYEHESTRKGQEKWWSGARDTYDEYLRAGSAGALAESRGLEQLGYWRELVEHTAYDSFWQQQAVDKLLAREPLIVPTLLVGGLFDQEDMYGAPAVYKALAPKDPRGEKLHLVMGPWNHGQNTRDGSSLGLLKFDGDTAGWFRREVMQPFLDHHLKDAPAPRLSPVLIYETGVNRWHRYDAWPRACAQGCPDTSRSLYLAPGGQLSFEPPVAAKDRYDEYISDPAKPVPYRQRPTLRKSTPGSTWREWLTDDQRHAASRPDVLVYETAPLTEPVRVAGEPIAHLFASTTGTDADWVVKIIDVWPDEDPHRPELGGYQQMVSAEIFRGRYREDFTQARPVAAGKTLPYRVPLPNVSHTFLPGHRIMVQIQSSWFPLYDRNPQSFIPNIMYAKPGDFVKATHRIWRTPQAPSAIDLPVIGAKADGDR